MIRKSRKISWWQIWLTTDMPSYIRENVLPLLYQYGIRNLNTKSYTSLRAAFIFVNFIHMDLWWNWLKVIDWTSYSRFWTYIFTSLLCFEYTEHQMFLNVDFFARNVIKSAIFCPKSLLNSELNKMKSSAFCSIIQYFKSIHLSRTDYGASENIFHKSNFIYSVLHTNIC